MNTSTTWKEAYSASRGMDFLKRTQLSTIPGYVQAPRGKSKATFSPLNLQKTTSNSKSIFIL